MMKFLWNSALGLLVVTGGLLGLTLPFGKLATAAGVPAMVWAFVISLGAGGVLLCVLLLRGERIRLTAHKLRYFFVTAAVSYAVPNLLMFSAIHFGESDARGIYGEATLEEAKSLAEDGIEFMPIPSFPEDRN